ncbi:MAG: tRNA (adenosine(37)-N6)-threonylcarbamoyltransferase complex dimerization subunit type 1 TsaB [Verrucomicrobiaceae bacterium]|nr:tRNA (adenosine(37)-N6)-threonylcarbamoyltransferase complex dimerization subunit type 1 TsaB [Verrucomicrobiaceae bacterium]
MPAAFLAIDLSTSQGSLAVVCGEEVRFEASFQSERSHNARVFAPLRNALEAAGADLTGVVIGNGPGSYTGVRIAIAAAQGIALSRGVWCAGWSSLAAPDIQTGPNYRVIGDARRQSFYLAEVQNGRLMPEIETVSPEVARERCADGSPWLTFDPQVPLGLSQVLQARPHAAHLGQIVAALPEAELRDLIARPLIPHYLAEAFITKPKRPPGTV